jgi:DNA-binding CsgD family transcriptional regulator
MLQDILKCSMQTLLSTFQVLDKYKDFVFWIRSEDMSKQIYSSASYEEIWQQDSKILYEIPLLWLDYLLLESKNLFMKQLQARHEQNYLDQEKNFVMFQIWTPNSETRYLHDYCFKCQSPSGKKFIVGISRRISDAIWHDCLNKHVQYNEDENKKIYNEFLQILKTEFGMTVVANRNNHAKQSTEKLSARELECLAHLCHGKTYKQIARDMLISPRTVESHVINILLKTKCKNRLEIIVQFSSFF